MDILESLKKNLSTYIFNGRLNITIGKSEMCNNLIFDIYTFYKNEVYAKNQLINLNVLFYDFNIYLDLKKGMLMCPVNNLQYCHDILSDNKIHWLNVRGDTKYGDYEFPSCIKKITINCNDKLFYKKNWKNTSVKHFDCWRVYNEYFVDWMHENTQIYSLDVGICDVDTISNFIIKNPNNSLQNVYTNGKKCCSLDNLLKYKRLHIEKEIMTVLLISKYKNKSEHKYMQYLPKPIILLILRFVYDIDYMKILKN